MKEWENKIELETLQKLWFNQEYFMKELIKLRYQSRKLEKYSINKEIFLLRKRISKLHDFEEIELKEEAERRLEQLIHVNQYDPLVIAYLDHFELIHRVKELLNIVTVKLQQIPHEHQYWLENPTARKKKQQFICPFCGILLPHPIDNGKEEVYEGKLGQKLYRKNYIETRTKGRGKS